MPAAETSNPSELKMSNVRMILRVAAAIGSAVALSSTIGCKDDAVVEDEPAGAVVGMAGYAGVAAGGMGGTGGAVAGIGGASGGVGGQGGAAGTIGGAAGASGVGGMDSGSGGTGGIGGASGGVGGMDSGGTGGVGGESGGAGGMSGGSGGAGGMGGGGGMGSDDPPGPCPSGWTCEDTSVLGATDKDGKPITGTSCGKGGLVECNDADPATSCPELTHPICAHVFGVTSCTQLCTP